MANEITIRVYEQGQGTVLNGGGSGTLCDRGASFNIPITGLSVGDHTLEVTAEDTGASKAESSRVSTGTITIDAAGFSDAFTEASPPVALATHNSGWESPWAGGTYPVVVTNVACITGGYAGTTTWYDRQGGIYGNSTSDICQIVKLPMTGDADNNSMEPHLILRGNGTAATGGYILTLGGINTTAHTFDWIGIEKKNSDTGYFTFTQICSKTYSAGTGISMTANMTIRFTCSGTSDVTFQAWVNSTEITGWDQGAGAAHDNTSPFTSGHPGFAIYSGESPDEASWDNFQDY